MQKLNIKKKFTKLKLKLIYYLHKIFGKIVYNQARTNPRYVYKQHKEKKS